MALQKDITDAKGVKTRYHAIKAFSCDEKEIKITIRSYTTKTTREAEKKAIENNILATNYEKQITDLTTELDNLLGATEPEKLARIDFLTNEINRLSLAENRPRLVEVEDRFYSEMEIAIPYFEPISVELLYDKICEREGCIFSGSVKI